MGDSIYESAKVLIEGNLDKLTTKSAGQEWEPRWVVLTPTTLQVFKGAGQPDAGAKAKSISYLGDSAAVEVVHEGEVDVHRAFAFSVAPGNGSSETVLSATTEAQFNEWFQLLHRQTILASEAHKRDMKVSVSGDLVDNAGRVIVAVEDVLKPYMEETPTSSAYTTPAQSAQATPAGIGPVGAPPPIPLPGPPAAAAALPPPPPPPGPPPLVLAQADAVPATAGEPVAVEAVPAAPAMLPPPPPPPSAPMAAPALPLPVPVAQSLPPMVSAPQWSEAVPIVGAGSVGEGSKGGPLAEGDGSGTARHSGAAAGKSGPQDLPKRPKNLEVDPALRTGVALNAMPTGARVKGIVISDMDAPPAPPQRGASARQGLYAAPSPASAPISVASKNHFIPHAALQNRGIEMPKAKFKAWAEAGGPGSGNNGNSAADSDALPSSYGGVPTNRNRAPMQDSNVMYSLASPQRAYPHGSASGQPGPYEGPPPTFGAGVPSSSGAFFYGGGNASESLHYDDDTSSTVGSIAGVPTSMTGTTPRDTVNAQVPRGVHFAELPTIMEVTPLPMAATPAPVPVVTSGLSLTTASPAYSYPQMGGSSSVPAPMQTPAVIPANVYSRPFPGGSAQASSGASTTGAGLQPRRLAEVAPPLPRNATATAGLPASRFGGSAKANEKDGAPLASGAGVSPSRHNALQGIADATSEAINAATAAATSAGIQVHAILKGQSPPSKSAAIAAALAAAGTLASRPYGAPSGTITAPPATPTERDGEGMGRSQRDRDGVDEEEDEEEPYSRSRAGSVDAGALDALDAVDIDARSVGTGHTGSIDTWAFYYGQDAPAGGRGRVEGVVPARVAEAALPDLAPPPRLVPLRDVKRAFDGATVYSEGMLPVATLPDLCAGLGMTLPAGWANGHELGAVAGIPAANGSLSRNDFLSWWKRTAVGLIKSHEAESLRRAALAASRAREAGPGPASDEAGVSARERRQRRRVATGGGGGRGWDASTVQSDRNTVTTFGERDTDADTATVSTVSLSNLDRVRGANALFAAMGLSADGTPLHAQGAGAAEGQGFVESGVVQAQAGHEDVPVLPAAADGTAAADDALAAVEASLQPIASSADELLHELATTLAEAEAARSATLAEEEASAVASVGVRFVDPNASPSEGGCGLAMSDKENLPEMVGTVSDKGTHVLGDSTVVSAVTSLGDSSAGAKAAQALASGRPATWVNKYRGGPMPSPLPALEDTQAASATVAEEPSQGKGSPRSTGSASPGTRSARTRSKTASRAPSPARVVAPPDLPTGVQGTIAAAALAAVAASLGGEVREGAGLPPSAYEATFLLPMPPALPPAMTALATCTATAPRAGPEPVGGGLGLAHAFDYPLVTAEAARFSSTLANGSMTVDEQEARGVAAELGVPPSPDGHLGMPFPITAARGAAIDLAGTVASVLAGDVAEEAWNERFQRLMEKPEWRFAAAAGKAVGCAAFLGRFASTATEAACTIIEELGLPNSHKSLQPMALGEAGAEPVWFYKGVLLRLAGAPPALPELSLSPLVTGPSCVERKVAGHTLRGLALVADAGAQVYRDWAVSAGTPDARRAAGKRRPPPLCAPLMCVVDYAGIRLYAMAIPPMEEGATLVLGRGAPAWASPFLQRSTVLSTMVRRVGRSLNLKPHAVQAPTHDDAGATTGNAGVTKRTVVLPLSVDVAGHSGTDKRLYIMNTARMMPSDAPHSVDAGVSGRGLVAPGAAALMGDNALLACQLRPEFVRSYDRPLSADAYRAVPAESAPEDEVGPVCIGSPPDAPANDLDVARASAHLLSHTVPAFVAALESGSVNLPDPLLTPSPHYLHPTTAVPGTPLDSAGFTAALHAAGINARHLGRVAATCSLPHVRELVETEMIARAVKLLLARDMRAVVGAHANANGVAHAHALLVRGSLAQTVCAVFNKCLGTSEEGGTWWRTTLSPLITAKFGYDLCVVDREGRETGRDAHPCPVHRPALLRALEHHCGAALAPSLPILPSVIPVPCPLPPAGCHTEGALALVYHQAAEVLMASRPVDKSRAPSDKRCNSAEKELYTAVPALAPLMALAGPKPASDSAPGSPLETEAANTRSTSYCGLPMVRALPYDLSRPHPFVPADLRPLHPQAGHLRSPLCGRAVETTAIGKSAEGLMATGNLTGALHALQLRLALLQGLGSAGEGRSDPAVAGPESADALLAIARLQLAMGRYADCGVTSLAVLVRVGGTHPSTARALSMRAQSVLLAGAGSMATGVEAAGLFASALATARAALGVAHPILCELASGMAAALSAIGRDAAGGALLEGAALLARRAYGMSHPAVQAYTAAAGHAARLASAAAYTTAREKGDKTPLGSLARAHGNVLAARACTLYEHALSLLDSSSVPRPTLGSSPILSHTVGDLIVNMNIGSVEGPARGASSGGSAAAHAGACASIAAALADSLASFGKLTSALASARRALQIRSTLSSSNPLAAGTALALLQSQSQVAALLERTGAFTEALGMVDAVSAGVRALAQHAEGVVAAGVPSALRCLARHTVRLAVRAQVGSARTALQRAAEGFAKSRGAASPIGLAYVLARLMDAGQPTGAAGAWVNGFLASSASRVQRNGSGLEDAPSTGVGGLRLPEPAPAEVLIALAVLLADGHGGMGGDFTSDAGVSAESGLRMEGGGMAIGQDQDGVSGLSTILLDLSGATIGFPTGVLHAAFGGPRVLEDALTL